MAMQSGLGKTFNLVHDQHAIFSAKGAAVYAFTSENAFDRIKIGHLRQGWPMPREVNILFFRPSARGPCEHSPIGQSVPTVQTTRDGMRADYGSLRISCPLRYL